MEDIYATRIDKLQSTLRKKRLDCLLISQPNNRRYLSGYSVPNHDIGESSGLLLIPAKGKPYLLTDFRFKTQAESDAKGFKLEIYTNDITAHLQKLLVKLGSRNLAFESHYTLFDFANKLKKTISKKSIKLIPTTSIIEDMRLIKDNDEIKKIRSSVLLNEKVFRTVYSQIKPGLTEKELALEIEATMHKMGAEDHSFDTIAASGSNCALPHAVPGNKLIEENSPILIDMGLVLDGYCSDMTRSFVFGTADDKYIKLHRIVRQAQKAAIKTIKNGVKASDVDKIARDIIGNAGYGKYFGHALGHGVGMNVHEGPGLSAQTKTILRTGMVITVEPGIYIPDWGGIRLENMVVVQDEGCEILNQDSTWLDI